MKKVIIKINAAANIADVLLYGYIGWEISANEFVAQLQALKSQGIKEINIRINSGGGNVFDGNAMSNAIDNLKKEGIKINTFNDAVAASMASMVLQQGEKRSMARNAFIMTHLPSDPGSGGTAEDLRRTATLLDDIKANFTNLLVARTKKEKQLVEQWLSNETWFTAQQALDNGLIDEITNEIAVENSIDLAKYPFKNVPVEIFNSIHNQQKPKTENNMKNLTAFITLLAIAADSTEEQVLAFVKKMKEDFDALKASMAKEKAEALVNGAVMAKKIPEGHKDTYVNLATGNFEATKKLLEEMKPVVKPTAQINEGSGEPDNADRSKWTFKDYMSKAPADLVKMRTENVAEYKRLYKAEYGKEPVMS